MIALFVTEYYGAIKCVYEILYMARILLCDRINWINIEYKVYFHSLWLILLYLCSGIIHIIYSNISIILNLYIGLALFKFKQNCFVLFHEYLSSMHVLKMLIVYFLRSHILFYY